MKANKRSHALINTRSGISGESRVAAELLRCGLRVAKPYWNDDEDDLLVLVPLSRHFVVPVSVQVKTVQFLPSPTTLRVPKQMTIQRLKKRYVESNSTLCLAIYRVDTDSIWLIAGPDAIRKEYSRQRNLSTTRKRRTWAKLRDGDDVGLTVRETDPRFDELWLLPKDDAEPAYNRIREVAEAVREAQVEVKSLERLWPTAP